MERVGSARGPRRTVRTAWAASLRTDSMKRLAFVTLPRFQSATVLYKYIPAVNHAVPPRAVESPQGFHSPSCVGSSPASAQGDRRVAHEARTVGQAVVEG